MKNNSVELEDPSLYNLHGIIRPGTEHQQQLKKKKKAKTRYHVPPEKKT